MGQKEDARKLKDARKALNDHKGKGEDDTYHRLNRAVADAEKKVSWWRR